MATARQVEAALRRLRKICAALLDVEERPSHGAPTFFLKGKKSFVMFHDNHHGDGRLAIWCRAAPGVQAQLVDEEPDRFFVPPYMGPSGWVGVRLDRDVDWKEVTEIVGDAFTAAAGPGASSRARSR